LEALWGPLHCDRSEQLKAADWGVEWGVDWGVVVAVVVFVGVVGVGVLGCLVQDWVIAASFLEK